MKIACSQFPNPIPHQWRCAEGVWIPEEKSENIDQFRTISLLSVEGKIYFCIVARDLTDFLLVNSYIDTSIQKGGIPKVPQCLEHTGVVTQLTQEAWENKGDLVDTFGSIPNTDTTSQDLIMDYYNSFSLRVSSGTTTSEWIKLEKGIITGCTISVIVLALTMNMLAKSAEECRRPLTKSSVQQPPIRAFMDDLTITTTSVQGSRWIRKGLE
ncbi:hypothetical protein N1851_029910 [Merluccius polli]|uniref:Reverse transcriptase domain-containing protein n=1 Tax=Merluccius polli TaxID=89951 RepID=A0AA47NQG8_MERPO|nr:hypothetical protein N1851_029910 [Merluccius polli]